MITLPTSSLAEVLRCVRDIFAALPSQLALAPEARIVVTIGKRPTYYEGAPPRVHFVPDRGTWGDPGTGNAGKGYVSGASLGCTAYVWGAGNADDWQSYDAADALADKVINALLRAARGRITGDAYEEASERAEENFGQAYKMRFTYVRGVQKDAEIDALPSSAIAPSPPDPMRPPGSPVSTGVETNVTVTPTT